MSWVNFLMVIAAIVVALVIGLVIFAMGEMRRNEAHRREMEKLNGAPIKERNNGTEA